MSATNAPTDPATPRKEPSLKSTLVELLLVTSIAVGAGVELARLGPPPPTTPPGSAVARGPAERAVLDLPSAVTNIGSPPDVWVRVETSIVFDPKSLPHPEAVAAEIAADELAYLRTIALAELQGPIGLQNIRQDLNDRAMTRSGDKISELVLRTLVVQ